MAPSWAKPYLVLRGREITPQHAHQSLSGEGQMLSLHYKLGMDKCWVYAIIYKLTQHRQLWSCQTQQKQSLLLGWSNQPANLKVNDTVVMRKPTSQHDDDTALAILHVICYSWRATFCVLMHVCVCVCVWERERECVWERERVCVCVCTAVWLC